MSHRTSVMVILIALVVNNCNGDERNDEKQSFIERIRNGVEIAGKIFDMTSGVAQLVSNAFKNNNEEKNQNEQSNKGIFSKVLKLLTMDVSKIGAVVMNAFIFLAQMIHTSITKKPALPDRESPRQLPDGTPYEWITENESPELQDLLKMTKDEDLTEKVIESIKNLSKSDTTCIQQLICKITPFVKGMQRALNDRDTEESEDSSIRPSMLFRYLPELDEFKGHSQVCETRYRECRLLD